MAGTTRADPEHGSAGGTRGAGDLLTNTGAAKSWNSLPLSPLSRKSNLKHIFLKKANSLLVCKTPFLHSLTVEWPVWM